MDLIFPALVVVTGLFALAFDRSVANTMNSLSIAIGQLFPPELRWPTVAPPWSRERLQNYLWFVRFQAVFMIAMGSVLLFG